MHSTDLGPTARDLRVFGLLWAAFFAGVGALVAFNPAALLAAAAFMTAAWLASLIFNPAPRREQATGFVMPLLFAIAAGAPALGVPARGVAAVAAIAGVAGALWILAEPQHARRLYASWMQAVKPVGWTVSQVILAIVFYLVLMPIGLALRLFGHDPLKRRFERGAETYWIERRATRDPASYFRQF